MGGGTTIQQATPPPQPTAAQSAKEFADALPTILKTQLQYQPQFDQATFDAFQKLGPEYARVSREVLSAYAPTLANLDETLAKQSVDISNQGLSDQELNFYKDQFKSLVGEQAGSGLGADFVSRNLLAEDISRRDYGRNLGLTLQGKVPISQAYQQPSSFQVASAFQPAYSTQQETFGSIFSGAGRPQVVDKPNYLGAIGGGLQGLGAIASGGGFGAIFK